MKVICEVCKKEFNEFPSRIKLGRGKYCSKECFGLGHGKKMVGRFRGINNPCFKGGRINDNGYISILFSTLSPNEQTLMHEDTRYKGKYVFEHRLVMAKHLNRSLKMYEIIHHRNGIKTDNRLENLELLIVGNHSIGHQTICPKCGHQFIS